METEKHSSSLFNSLRLLEAYEKAIDANIISTITDTKGNIVHANSKFCEVSQYSINQILGQNHRIINSGHHPEFFFTNMWQTISRGEVWHSEIKNKAKDNSYYWVDTVIVPIKNEKELITHYLSLRTLITDRKLLEIKKEKYLSSLEVLLVMTSNNIKKPLSNCLSQIKTFGSDKKNTNNELTQIVFNLKKSVSELEIFTGELSRFIMEMEK